MINSLFGGMNMDNKKVKMPKIIKSGLYDVLKSNNCTVTHNCYQVPTACKSVR